MAPARVEEEAPAQAVDDVADKASESDKEIVDKDENSGVEVDDEAVVAEAVEEETYDSKDVVEAEAVVTEIKEDKKD